MTARLLCWARALGDAGTSWLLRWGPRGDAGTGPRGGGGRLAYCSAGVVASRLYPEDFSLCRQVAEVKNPLG